MDACGFNMCTIAQLHTLFEMLKLDAFFKADQVTQQATVAISAAGDEPKSWEREQLLGFFDCKVARLYNINSVKDLKGSTVELCQFRHHSSVTSEISWIT